MTYPKIGIDLMGGDTSPLDLLPVLKILEEEDIGPYSLMLFGEKTVLDDFARLNIALPAGCDIKTFEAEETIAMDEDPLSSIRKKRDSSLCQGILHLKEKKLDAFITLGNTGALTAASRMHLPLLEGISRPALIARLPTKKGTFSILDVGANVSCSAQHLIEFALLGDAFERALGTESPQIGLLNIGREKTKGPLELREAYQTLQNLSPISFIGNVEGREAFQGKVDVLITDGFSGNIFLKTSEGIASFIIDELKENASFSHLEHFQKLIYFNEYPGALLCGVEGLIIKCHGSSSHKALFHATREAINLVRSNFIDKIKENLLTPSLLS